MIQLIEFSIVDMTGMDPIPFGMRPIVDAEHAIAIDSSISHLHPFFGFFILEGRFTLETTGTNGNVHGTCGMYDAVCDSVGSKVGMNVSGKDHVDLVIHKEWFQMFSGCHN